MCFKIIFGFVFCISFEFLKITYYYLLIMTKRFGEVFIAEASSYNFLFGSYIFVLFLILYIQFSKMLFLVFQYFYWLLCFFPFEAFLYDSSLLFFWYLVNWKNILWLVNILKMSRLLLNNLIIVCFLDL